MHCDQCEAMMINGVFCHETGCPNQFKIWDNLTASWVDEPTDDEYMEEDYE